LINFFNRKTQECRGGGTESITKPRGSREERERPDPGADRTGLVKQQDGEKANNAGKRETASLRAKGEIIPKEGETKRLTQPHLNFWLVGSAIQGIYRVKGRLWKHQAE